MKVKFKNISATEEDDFFQSEHLVLAYGDYDDKSKIFLIADRELEIIEPYDKNLEITDTDLSEYINYPTLNYDKEFYVHRSFLMFAKQFERYHDIKTDSIWIKSKLHNFFLENEYKLTNDYIETVLNENYKLTLIKGFLIFANHFINKNNIGSSYRNNFHFGKTLNLSAIIPDNSKDSQHYKLEQLEISKYENALTSFITEKLYHNEEKDTVKDKYLIRDFFELIDSIFIDSIEELYKIKTFYDDMFVIKCNHKFYFLNYDWTS